MKLSLIIFILIVSMNSGWAQKKGQEKLDSLFNELNVAKDDTNKVKLYKKIADEYRKTDYKKALMYMHQSLDLALKLDFKDGISSINYSLGNIYLEHSDYTNAIKCYNQSMDIERTKGDKKLMASLYHNIANVYLSWGNYPKAIEIYLQALKLFEEIGDKNGTANCHINIGNIYGTLGDKKQSHEHSEKALKLYQDIGSKSGIAVSYVNIGDYYTYMKDFEKANENCKKSLKLYEELNDAGGMDLALINLSMGHLEQRKYEQALEYGLRALQISKDNDMPECIGFDYMTISDIYYKSTSDKNWNPTNSHKLNLKNNGYQLANAYIDSAIDIFPKLEMIKEYSQAVEIKAHICEAMGDYKKAFEYFKLFKVLNDSIFNIEKDKKITQSAMQYDFDKKEASIKAENEKQQIQQRNIRNIIAVVLVGALIFLIVVYRQRNKISKEKARSEELLLNILPYEVAEELKDKGSADAKHFDEVTVLFTDFKGFTLVSEKLSPTELVAEINHCFSAFDHIMQKHGIEKIKTIGDAYMAAGGIPTPNKTHALDVVNAALDIQQFMHQLKLQKEAEGKLSFEIRIGIHTGNVVAGIVGVKKFAYDIWGDTVNTASRMESSGEEGKVNISGTTYELVKDRFKCSHRGKIQAKNKGELDMYFVEEIL